MRNKVLYFLIAATLASCCSGTKCQVSEFKLIFRIVDQHNGSDLVFGPAAIYPASRLTLYSLQHSDTVFHTIAPGPNSIPGGDSLLYVQMDPAEWPVAFLRLSAGDTDTLQLTYPLTDASPCCDDFKTAAVIAFNNTPPVQGNRGILLLQKK
jgi:hypothetical protein